MKSNKKNISNDSLERLVLALMQCTDEDGFLLNISPAMAFQDWLIKLYPKPIQDMWSRQHSVEIPEKERNEGS